MYVASMCRGYNEIKPWNDLDSNISHSEHTLLGLKNCFFLYRSGKNKVLWFLWGLFYSNNECFMATIVGMRCSKAVFMLIGSWKGGNLFRAGT